MSKNGNDAVNQQAGGGGKTVHLNFHSYQQSQGGKYECRVAGPGNNSESLYVCIGECCTFLLTIKFATSNSGVFLYQVYIYLYHLMYYYYIRVDLERCIHI